MDSKTESNSRVTMAGDSFTARSLGLLNNIGEYIAEYSIGQFVLRKIDDVLWIVEKIAQWSVPITAIEKSKENSPSTNDTNEKPPQNTLVRPLPWILFFPALIALRIFRGVVNILAMLLGMETITSVAFVKFISEKRGKLNTIRSTGIINALIKKNGTDSLIRRLYSNILSALCFQRVCMESNTNNTQNVEPMIVGSNNNEINGVDTEEHNHVENNNMTDNNVEEIIKRIKDYAERSSSYGEESDIVLTDSEDIVNDDDDSVSSTNEMDNEAIDENKKNTNADAKSDDSTYLTPTLESIAPSINSQIIAEENEDSDVSTRGTALNPTTSGLSSNRETSSKRDLESEVTHNVDNIDVLNELLRNSLKNMENGEDQSSNSSASTLIINEFINNEIHTENDNGNSQEISTTVDDSNNLEGMS